MNLISTYVILYPVIVSIIWIISSIFFSIQQRTVPLVNQPAGQPDDLVSVLIPAHNEGATLSGVVESVAALSYQHIELILIDDGSDDNTFDVMQKLARQYAKRCDIKLVPLMPNRGKANALNEGAKQAHGKFLLCLDADCYVDADVLQPMLARFYDNENLGAVAGKPIVRNRTSLLGRLELLEYIGVIDIIKRGQAFITGHITTVSGVVVAYRRETLAQVGWWNPQALTEDIDITWRLYQHQWQVSYCPDAVAWILVPEHVGALVHQRQRWARGGFEVLWRNKGMLLRGPLSAQWLLLDMVLSDTWALACAFVLLFYVFTIAFTQTLIMDGVVLFLLVLISIIQFLIGFADSKQSDFIAWQDLLLLPVYIIFYWFINLVSCLSALASFFLDPHHAGTWRSPDRGL
ncbi:MULTISPECIES: glycosyltransferase family 2 protein [Furfurilactobacillus]|uniref:Glycosyltransferase n=2 Tax=Furfurilactobacillus TaxID=2767882 RepID=A0ABT6DDW0_9LACO|nr:glycosyltransferase family 2 protein [Furfurilactobacillus milii]QLE65640.1 glycosyl transferase [Furfurilactobacillus rossiae]MCF6161788.1 glycosyltransferase [Furfurilactobacillus milii]MCF6164200.1 glycosyltransferase [Furfurilactobacillus milii]MDF9914743.1 glycosyltransferase [Furfurilactobacillus milii]MYV06220.1 glycosyltransferase [Furfurilactobacillus milii]